MGTTPTAKNKPSKTGKIINPKDCIHSEPSESKSLDDEPIEVIGLIMVDSQYRNP